MRNLLNRLTSSALDLLFPLQCAGCQREGRLLCADCVNTLPRLEPPYCAGCAQPGVSPRCRWCLTSPLAVDGIRAPFRMEGAVREAVHSLKYRDVRAAATELGRLLANYLAAHPVPGEVLVPVPLHPRRMRQRGYNQSGLLARQLGRHTGLPVLEGALVRTKDTPPQVQSATRKERHGNVAGAFRCTGDVRDRTILLVDDVVTTGSTMSACATALKTAGAASVWGLALAKEG